MRKEDVKKGMKVVPFQKTEGVGISFEQSCAFNSEGVQRPYLIVLGAYTRTVDLFDGNIESPAEIFGYDDFHQYIEPDQYADSRDVTRDQLELELLNEGYEKNIDSKTASDPFNFIAGKVSDAVGIAQIVAHNSEMKKEIESLKQQLEERDERIKAIEAENKMLSQRIAGLTDENNYISERCKTTSWINQNLSQENEQRQSRIDKLDNTIDVLLEKLKLCK